VITPLGANFTDVLAQPVAIMVDGQMGNAGKWGRLARKLTFTGARSTSDKICLAAVDHLIAGDAADFILGEFQDLLLHVLVGADITRFHFGRRSVRSIWPQPFEYYLIRESIGARKYKPELQCESLCSAVAHATGCRPIAGVRAHTTRAKFGSTTEGDEGSAVRSSATMADPEHMKELHCTASLTCMGHSLAELNPALLKALGCGNCVLALNTPFNGATAEYGIYRA